MKTKFVLLVLTVCMLVCSCAPAVTATAKVDALMVDAMRLYYEGDYEETILLYSEVIEIEPRNVEAHLFLGKTYGKLGNIQEAISALETALQIDGENPDIVYELGCLYLANNQYAESQALAEKLWNNGNDNAPAGVLLLLSLAGQENKIEQMFELASNEIVAAEVNRLTNDGNVYTVGKNLKELNGVSVAIYPEGFIYFGQFSNGIRSGAGIWFYPYITGYYVGKWENDMPNGEGEEVTAFSHAIAGNYTNGLANGEMAIRNLKVSGGCPEYHPYTAKMGIIVVEDKEGLYQDIQNGEYTYAHVYAWCGHADGLSTYVIPREMLNAQTGIEPWVDIEMPLRQAKQIF